ncbi:MAG: hypothetical protein IJU91_06430 [Selenomonadaceae bacterium]|nr:hypothetical protein [Selenomonadaceae bacterium]
MGREKIGTDGEQATSARQKLGRRVVGKVRDSVSDDDTERAQDNSGEQSFLGGVLGAVMDIVGEVAKKDSINEGNRKGSGRKPVSDSRNEGRVASVASSVADQLRRRK